MAQVGFGGAVESFERGLEEVERMEQKHHLAQLQASASVQEGTVGLGGAFQSFERGLEEVERTEQKHHLTQLKIMREQMKTVTSTVSAMEAQVLELKEMVYRGLGQVRTELTDTSEKLREDLTRQENIHISELKVTLEARLADLEKRFQNEMEERIALGRQVGEEVLCSSLFRKNTETEVRALKEQWPRLAEADRVFKEQLETLMKVVEREGIDRKIADDGLFSKLGGVQNEVKTGDAANMQRIEDFERELVKQSADRSDSVLLTRRLVDGVAATVLELRNEVQANQKACRVQFDCLEPKISEQQKRLDRIAGERIMQVVRLEQQVTELAGRFNEGIVERNLQNQEQGEVLTTLRQKLIDVVSEQNRDLNSKLQTFEVWMQRAMESEEAVRGSELRKVEAKVWADSRSTDEQLSEIRSRIDVVAESSRNMTPMIELQASQSRIQDLERQFRGLYVALEDLRQGTETEMALLEGRQQGFLDDTLQDISLRFKDNLARRQTRAVPVSLPSTPFAALTGMSGCETISTIRKAFTDNYKDTANLSATEAFSSMYRDATAVAEKTLNASLDAGSAECSGLAVISPLVRGLFSTACREAALATEIEDMLWAHALSVQQQWREDVVVSGHIGSRCVNGTYKSMDRKYMEAPVYYCKQADTYLFRSARIASWGIGDRLSGALIALAQDSASTAGEIKGTWKIYNSQEGTYTQDPSITLVLRLPKAIRDAVVVVSPFSHVRGGYQKSRKRREGYPVFVNPISGMVISWDGYRWLIAQGPDLEVAKVAANFAASAPTVKRSPTHAEWQGTEVKVVSLAANDSESDEE